MKKTLAILMALAMTLSLAACGDEPEQKKTPDGSGGETVEIAVVLKTLAAEYWNYVKAGCEAAGKELGVHVTVVGPNAESDIEGQVAQIEQQLGAGCDAIVCSPNDAGAAINALQPAIDNGTPVIAVDTNVGIDGQKCFVGTSNVEAAYEGGKWGAAHMREGSGAIIIYGQEGDATSNMRKEGYTRACEEAGITILDALSGQNTTDGSVKVMEDLLSAHPGKIGLVLCHNDDSAVGALNACQNAGVNDVVIVGFNGDKFAAELIQQGQLQATVAQQPYAMGYQAVEYAYKAVQGEEIPEVVNAPVEVVTKENAEAYLESLA